MEKLFILVDNKYDLPYQGVQGGHAGFQWLLDNKDTQTWNNGHVVYLQTNNLQKWMYKLDHKGMKYSYFVEPNVDFQITALACCTDDYNTFRQLKLMGAK